MGKQHENGSGYRFEIAYPAELVQAGSHFHSGCNMAGELRGLALSGRHFGISLGEIRRGLLEELELYDFGMQRVFVDTGAFSEIDFPGGVPTLVAPISDADMSERLAIALEIAHTFGRRALIVAPDRVGCQTTTLERLAKHGAEVAAIAATGAEIMVCVQKGALPMSAMYRAECEILGLRVAPVAGVPMMKDATTLAELGELVESLPWFGARIHLLGLGPKAKYRRYEKAIAVIKRIRPNAVITSDSTQAVLGEVGRTNGRENVRGEIKGGPRRLTSAQDRARARGLRRGAVKQSALIEVGLEDIDAELERALEAGWFDVELFDTLEEARADFARRKAERAARNAPAPATEAA